MAETANQSGADLRSYLTVLRRRKWSIILVTLLTFAGAMALSFSQTPMYRSSARVLVRSIETGDESSDSVNLETERALVDSTAIATIVSDALSRNTPPSDLLRGLSVTVEGTTEILHVEYEATTPGQAKILAQGFAEGYLEFRREQALAESEQEIARVEDEISGTKESIAEITREVEATDDSAERSRLSAQRDSLVARLGVLQFNLDNLTTALGSIGQGGGQVVEPATLPGAPSTPRHLQNALLGLMLGLVLGIGFAFLRERLDDRLRGRPDFEEQIGAPVLAMIPRVSGRRNKEPQLVSVTDPASPASEAYRTLRTAVQFTAAGEGLRTIAITSPGAGEGKSATTANLAVALATVGKQVVTVSGDLRKPSLHRFFGLSNEVGLSDVLRGDISIEKAIQATAVPGVSVIAGGPVPMNPAELLDSSQMHRLVRTLRAKYDIVLLDGPPVLAMADALILCPYGDGVLLIADAEKTSRQALQHAREQIEQVGGKVIGGVLNRFDPSGASYYSPYYGSTYGRSRYTEERGRMRATSNGSKASRVGRES